MQTQIQIIEWLKTRFSNCSSTQKTSLSLCSAQVRSCCNRSTSCLHKSMKQQCLHSLQSNEWVSMSCAAEMQRVTNSMKHSIQSTCQSRSFTDLCSWEASRKQTTERFQSHQSVATVSDFIILLCSFVRLFLLCFSHYLDMSHLIKALDFLESQALILKLFSDLE